MIKQNIQRQMATQAVNQVRGFLFAHPDFDEWHVTSVFRHHLTIEIQVKYEGEVTPNEAHETLRALRNKLHESYQQWLDRFEDEDLDSVPQVMIGTSRLDTPNF